MALWAIFTWTEGSHTLFLESEPERCQTEPQGHAARPLLCLRLGQLTQQPLWAQSGPIYKTQGGASLSLWSPRTLHPSYYNLTSCTATLGHIVIFILSRLESHRKVMRLEMGRKAGSGDE